MDVPKAIALLGLAHPNQCDDKSIISAWKRKLLKTHPDKSNALHATMQTQELNEAKEFLLQQAKHAIRAQFEAPEKQTEQELRAALERRRQAAAFEQELNAAFERIRKTNAFEQGLKADFERARKAAVEQHEKETQAARERERRATAVAEQEMRAFAERARQAAERHSQLPPELQQSINHCIQDNLNYAQARRVQQLRSRQDRFSNRF